MRIYRHDGARLLERRLRRGLTREDVAAQAGMDCDQLTLAEWGFLPVLEWEVEQIETAIREVAGTY